MKEQTDSSLVGNNVLATTFNISSHHCATNNQLQQQQYSHHHQHSKDVGHSSDTEDCDLELGSGRLVIDLEAESASEEKSASQKSSENQSFNSINNFDNVNNNALHAKKLNSNFLKMNHCFSELASNSIPSAGRAGGRVSYSISSLPNSCAPYASSPTASQVSYSTISVAGHDQSANSSQPNKCIKMKIKRNPLTHGPHAPLSASSQLSATLHQQHQQSSPPPSSSSSSSSSASQQPFSTMVVTSCSVPVSTGGSNGYQPKATLENPVFTYKIQHSSINNCMTSASSFTCKNVPLGSLPSLSSSAVAEGGRGMNHHQGNPLLNEVCQATSYSTSSTGMPTRNSKQPPNKRAKQAQNVHNNVVYRDSSIVGGKPQIAPTIAATQSLPHEQQNVAAYANSTKQPGLSTAPYSNVTHQFGYDPSVCTKYAPRGGHKNAATAATLANGREKVSTPGDPYDFNCTTEENAGVVLKKMKVDKCERGCSPIAPLKRDVEVEACHVGVITDPDCLGPCEPGTSVTLEGIVWNETENGLLVVNVTWRGKTYVGTLMDATRHHWAPPRFTGESPTSDLDGRTQKGRGKRGRNNPVAPPPTVRPDNGSDRKLRSNRNNGNSKQLQTAPSPVRSSVGLANEFGCKKSDPLSNYNICRSGKTSTRSESRMSYSESFVHDEVTAPGSNCINSNSLLIECPEENCNKKYRNSVGLKYHHTRCHQNKPAAAAPVTNTTSTSTSATAAATAAATTAATTDVVVTEANAKISSTKDAYAVNLKNDVQESLTNASNPEETVLSQQPSSSSAAVQKHRSSKINSVLRTQTSNGESLVAKNGQKVTSEAREEATNVQPNAASATCTSLAATSSSSSVLLQNNVPVSSCTSRLSPDKTLSTGVVGNEQNAAVANGPSSDACAKPGACVESEIASEPTNVKIQPVNNPNSISSNELKLHSISTMTHQTRETFPVERNNKRKKKERHSTMDRNDVNVISDGCSAPNMKNQKLDNEFKENNIGMPQDRMFGEPLSTFSGSSNPVVPSSSSASSLPSSSASTTSSAPPGNLYAGSLERPIYISTSTDECMTSFKSSMAVLTSPSSVIRSAAGLPTSSVYDVGHAGCLEVCAPASTDSHVVYSTLASSISPDAATPKQMPDKRSSPRSTPGDFPPHTPSVISIDLNSPDFPQNKRLRLSPNEESKNMQKSSSEMTICQDVPSPAYSDISDANENAPMLEKEANQTNINNDDNVSVMRCMSSEGTSAPMGSSKQMQDSYVCGRFYDLMPQLTPVVSSPAMNRDFTSKFSIVGKSSSTQYVREEATSPEKPNPVMSDVQKADNKFVESTISKKHDFVQSSQHGSSSQQLNESISKNPSTSIIPPDVNPNQQVHLLTVPSITPLGFPQALFPGQYNNFLDRDVRAQWERFMELHQKQFHEGELLKQDHDAKYGNRSEASSLKLDDRYKHSTILPAPPSLIPDYSKFKPKEEYPGMWDAARPQSRDVPDIRGAPTPDHHNGKGVTSDKFDRRYLPPPHMLEQPSQHHLHQSSKAASGEGGKPSAVVAPQTREKIGTGSQMPKGTYDPNNRENRALLHQQHLKYSSTNNSNYPGTFATKNSREGRQQLKEDNTSIQKRDDSVMKSSSSSSSLSNSKSKLKSCTSEQSSSQPTGLQLPPSPSPMPAPYPPPPPFYTPFLTPGAPYMHNPFDPTFLSTMNPMAALSQQSHYGIHPQLLHPVAAAQGALTINTSDPKSQPPSHQHHRTCIDFESNVAHHKIHELKEVAKGETSTGNPGGSLENRPLSSGGIQHSSVIQSSSSSSATRESVKDKDLSTEPTLQRHLHTHHHMHVIGPYSYMNSEAAMLASQQANSSGVSPQLPRPSYLGK